MTGDGDLWAIAAYFNPLGYERRRANFRAFRRHLGVPLAVAESAAPGAFDLSEGDAEILVRAPCADVLWQKERLLNLALARLPASCRLVVWLDCDVLFEDPDWPDRLRDALSRHRVVHALERITVLRPEDADAPAARPGDRVVWDSMLVKVRRGELPFDPFAGHGTSVRYGYSVGHAWAARRDLLDRHGLYDACVLGGGDKLIAAAAMGRHETAARGFRMPPPLSAHYLRWAGPFAAEVAQDVGVAPIRALHLWHGDLGDRRYVGRQELLVDHGFDPARDVALTPEGAWRWSGAAPALRRAVRDYFASRREDGPAVADRSTPAASGAGPWANDVAPGRRAAARG